MTRGRRLEGMGNVTPVPGLRLNRRRFRTGFASTNRPMYHDEQIQESTMVYRIRARHRVLSLCIMSLAIVRITLAQCPTHQEEKKETLTVVTLGQLVSHGRYLPFRVYSASDGTTGRIVMAAYDSLEDAQKQIDAWTKDANEVTCREQPHQIGDAHRTSERILAQATSTTDSKTKVFLIIRRDGLNCYLINSSSVQVALQIESFIDERS